MESIYIHLGGGLIVLAVVGIYWLRRRWHSRISEHWPTTSGHVEQRYVNTGDRIPVATVAYSYSVNGEYFAGFYEQAFPNEDMAYEFLDRFQKDSKIVVRFAADKPSRSVLREEDQVIIRAGASIA